MGFKFIDTEGKEIPNEGITNIKSNEDEITRLKTENALLKETLQNIYDKMNK
tara:strand:+ start:147 stop:302 length:156 start_codon:yes stop_codon:yes gene_type:complete